MATNGEQAPNSNIELLNDESMKEVCDLVTQAFLKGEPMTSSRPRDGGEFFKFVHAVAQQAVAQRLAWVSRDAATGAPQGALLAVDNTTPEDLLGMEHLDEDTVKVLEKTDEILLNVSTQQQQQVNDKECLNLEKKGHCVHLFLLGVDPSHQGKGISKRLLERGLNDARDMGFRFAVAECTNAATQHVTEHLFGFDRVGVVPYADNDFASIVQQHTGAVVVQKDLNRQ